jgi:D-tyrosyl-tRNA(Tyr) deacylase
MRVVLQRVTEASVAVNGGTVASIRGGFLALVGVGNGDTSADADALVAKVAGLRVFSDIEGRFNDSLMDVAGAVLVVSQFTLLGDARRGRRPSFSGAAPPDVAEPLIDQFAAGLRAEGIEVATGVFGASMQVRLVNDGPVTLVIDASGGRVL